ncbi:hypothetical protein MMPV_001456 [Pyropia vietnamensis]
MDMEYWVPAALDIPSLEITSAISTGAGGDVDEAPLSAAAPPPSAPAALGGSTSSGGSSSSLDHLEQFNTEAWSSLAASGPAPTIFSPVTPLLGEASNVAAKRHPAVGGGGGWDDPSSPADLFSHFVGSSSALPTNAAPAVAPDALLRVDPDLLNATDRRQRRRRLRSLKNPRGRVGGMGGWVPAHGGVTKSLASSPLPTPHGWTPSAAAPSTGGRPGGRPPSPRGTAPPSAGGGVSVGSPTAVSAAAAAAADAAVDKKAARVIRNREVALKARQAAKDKAARLAADNAALTARVAELLAENAALVAAATSLRAQVAADAGSDAPRNWA